MFDHVNFGLLSLSPSLEKSYIFFVVGNEKSIIVHVMHFAIIFSFTIL
jgi:hypothetical protein